MVCAGFILSSDGTQSVIDLYTVSTVFYQLHVCVVSWPSQMPVSVWAERYHFLDEQNFLPGSEFEQNFLPRADFPLF